MNPYPILGGLALLIAAAFGGAHVGRKLEHEQWQAKEIFTAAAIQKDLIAAHDKYVRLQNFNEAKSRRASADHAQALSTLSASYQRDIAAVRVAGGLRLSRSVCADSHATTAEATSAGRPDETIAGTIQLPGRVENDLFALTKRADEMAEQLRALQGWIVNNGFYGEP